MSQRYRIYKKLDIVENDIDLSNILSIQWGSFTFPNGYRTHRLSQADIEKPWLISFLHYGTIVYEDFIWLVNNIVDPLELKPDTELKIPVEDDIKDFILQNRR